MDLFQQHRLDITEAEAPLAARLRPRTLDEFVGQDAIVGPGRLLRRAIQADQLSSLIFYGPPGTGKTTLARIIANTTQAHFIAINAVLSGVKEIREAIAAAQDKRGMYGQRTILFVDEVHRFNKAQQDALLPWVENGTVILIGATTENPYFEVNKALVSRSRLFQLKPLDEQDLRTVVQQALQDSDRGYGKLDVQLEDAAIKHLVNVANGDARALLNALELAVETTPPDAAGSIHVTLAVAEESIQRRAVLYDKEGDAHFDTISAFIKSVRGSDPDAALYWLARMVYAGEDPRFIFRRLLILAGEDVGMADPNAIAIVHACAETFDRIGLPEGRYPLAHATLYLATAPKSNSVMGFFDALSAVEQEREGDIPNPLKDANRDKKGFGHGAGYLYPHAYRDHWVAQQYLPSSLQGQVFYQPSDRGFESAIQTQVARRREAQLAALLEGTSVALPEVLTFGPVDSAQERWLQRTLGQAGDRLGEVRDRLFALAAPQRHHVVLDLNAGSGLLTWEAIRQTPEGSVIACVRTTTDADAMTQQAAVLPELTRPIVLQTSLAELPTVLKAQVSDVRFDHIMGRNALMREVDKAGIVRSLANWLQPNGTVTLAESIPHQAQRLYQLLDPGWLSDKLYQKLVKAEEAIYTQPDDSMVNWDAPDLQAMFETAGFTVVLQVEPLSTEMLITAALVDRWFAANSIQPSYATHLSHHLSQAELTKVRSAFTRLVNQTVKWRSTIAFVQAHC
ncbi:AAA family ATPase [Phormidium sp. FACHB-592]|uniref:AAA family ATPase n=1 Tax=Stenomitos frigidus AS-A4 TaxID=2933935 RepID=A0ABV0KJR0_9CYAN|nr:AAA family ATPase [Phormidium sp. FACHB-592]MBD2074462.1 AAA family ATPase [Phormidium sp. FACHB-592]